MRGRDKVHATRRVNYQKVLVAVYLTVDDDGMWNPASNEYIARAAGLSAGTVGAYLQDLERDGVIEIFRPAEFGLSFRWILIRDHPKADKASRKMWGDSGRRRPRRVRRLQGVA